MMNNNNSHCYTLATFFALLLLSSPISAQNASVTSDCANSLTRRALSNTLCPDGSAPAYYVAESTTASRQNFVIWLGDGDICGNPDECTKYCPEELLYVSPGEDPDGYCLNHTSVATDPVNQVLYEPFTSADDSDPVARASCYASTFQCGSKWININSTAYGSPKAETFMCNSDNHFAFYTRIFIPSCTLDWWIGNGSTLGGIYSNYWIGTRILDDLIQQLDADYNISQAQRVMFGGTGGGGIGAANQFKRIRYNSALKSVPSVLLVMDSSWLIPSDRFANLSAVYMGDTASSRPIEQYLTDQTALWLTRAQLDPDCLAFWFAQRENCFYPYEIIRRALSDEKVMVIQSQYDILSLGRLDLLNLTLTRQFVDNASYAQGAVNFIEGYASNLRRTVESAAYYRGQADGLYFFEPACAVHGYLTPTKFQAIDGRLVDLGRAGHLVYNRDSDPWLATSIGGLTVRDALVAWLNSEGTIKPGSTDPEVEIMLSMRNGVRADRCASFLCNPSCDSQLIPFTIASIWGPCSQRLTVAYCAVVLSLFWAMFILAYAAVFIFRRTTSRHWSRVIASEKKEKQNGDPKEIEQKYRVEAEDELVRDAFATNRQVHLMVKGLSYWAPPRTRKGLAYQIIRNVTATFPAGEVHALMGPSGSGKSTMLDLVALTRDSGFMVGSHYVNGVESHTSTASFLRDWLRHNISYVRQADNLFPLLTVREHLTHAAWLMLPEFMTTESKLRRVWQVIKLLDLESAADTICGDGGVLVEGGISGGQRRRVSVATQLLRLPAALILDEPTSGLDSTTALLLVKSLHSLAHRGKTNIIMTIHQPRREIYRYLDTIKILVNGRLLFAGAPREAYDHFEVSKKLNIGDEVLDQLAKSTPEQIANFQSKYENGKLGKRTASEVVQEVVLDFDAYTAWELQQVLIVNALAEGRWSWTESSSAPTMMWVLLSRTLKRGGFDITKTISMSLFGGLLVGIVFLSANDSYTRHTAMCYLSIATMTFLQGTFIGDRYWAEKFMYDFESDAGTARPWISFLWSMFARLFVSSTLEALAFALPLFFVGKMNNQGNRLSFYLLIMVMTAIATATQYLLVEIYFMRPDDKRTGALVNIALLSLAALFNGFIIQLKDLPIYLSWIPVIMVSYWGFVGLLINDLSGFAILCTASELECSARTGDNILKGLNYDDRDVYICLFALLCMTCAYVSLGVFVFFFKYVARIGDGLTRKSSKDTRADEATWKEGVRKLQEEMGANSTMDAVLSDGKKMQKLKREGSDGKLGRSDSLGRNNSQGTIESDTASFDISASVNPLTHQASINDNTLVNMDNENDGDDSSAKRCCQTSENGVITQIFISRLLLVTFFLIDFLCTAVICNGVDKNAKAGSSLDDLINNADNITSLFGSGLSLSGVGDNTDINVLFVAITGIFLVGYTIQFVVQFFLLIPRDADGRIRCCTRVAILDILGAVFLGLDFVFLVLLLGAGAGISLQIYLMAAIRVTRVFHIGAFWFKIAAFHELRAKAYLEFKNLIMEDYDPTAYQDVAQEEDLVDNKPVVPAKSTKPAIPVHLVTGAGRQGGDAAGGGGGGGFARKLIKSIRGIAGGGTTSSAVVAATDGPSRRSNRLSINALMNTGVGGPPAASMAVSVQNARMSLSRLGGLPPPVVPRRPISQTQNVDGAAGAPPIPTNRPAMLPPSLQFGMALGGIPPPPGINTAGAGNRMSLFRGSAPHPTSSSSGGFAPAVPARPAGGISGMFGAPPLPAGGLGAPPPIPSRIQNNLAGFGIGGGARRLNQTAMNSHVPRGVPGLDEV